MAKQNTTAPQTERPRILLVEDDVAVRRSLQLLLRAKGFDVRAYATGEALLADPLVASASCFIADFRMDGLDGLEILERLRNGGWCGPAILITAYATTDLAQRATAQGFDAVIEKPFREQALADAVTRLTAAA